MAAEQVDSYLRGSRGAEAHDASRAAPHDFRDLSYLPFSGSVLGELADRLDGYTMTKSSLHFPIDRPLPKALVERLIAVRRADAGLALR